MGCFLTTTERDLEQIMSRMMGSGSSRRRLRQQQAQAAAAVWDQRRRSDENFSNRRDLSRRYNPSTSPQALAPTNQSKLSLSHESPKLSSRTRAQQFLEEATFVSSQFPGYLYKFLDQEIGRANNEIGNDLGESIAAIVLEQAKNIIISHHSHGKRGFDLVGKELDTDETIVVEVKTKGKDVKGERFGTFLDSGYGYKQCSDGWILEVGKKTGIKNTANIKVWGVHINPDKNTVSIYQRMNSDATSWKRIMNETPLADFQKIFESAVKS